MAEDVMELQPDVKTGTEPVRCGTKRASSTWEGCADKINMVVSAADVTVMKFWSQIRTHTDARVWSVQVASQIQKRSWRQSSARECPTKPRETKPSQEL